MSPSPPTPAHPILRSLCSHRLVAIALILTPLSHAQVGQKTYLFQEVRGDQSGSANGGTIFWDLDDGGWSWWYQNTYQARISPDLAKVAYVFANTPDPDASFSSKYHLDVVVADLNGQNPALIAQHSFNPVWSPDGTKLAYLRAYLDENGDEPIQYRLYVRDYPGGGETQIAPAVYPHQSARAITWLEHSNALSWSPDGTTIAYTGPQGIHAVNVTGGGEQILLENINADPNASIKMSESFTRCVWHPTGNKMAVARAYIKTRSVGGVLVEQVNVHAQVVVVSLPSGTRQVISHNANADFGDGLPPKRDMPLAWTEDGSALIWSRNSAESDFGTWMTHLDGTATKINGFVPESAQLVAPLPTELVVNVDGDESDASPADGVVDVDLSTPGRQITLRAALEAANDKSGIDTITFDIPAAGTPEITPASPLPVVTEGVTVDGGTQPGSGCVRIRGSATAPVGLTMDASSVTVRGLMITECPTAAIDVVSGGYHVVESCVIGTDAAGTAGLGNGIGIRIRNATDPLVGGIQAAARNVISGNTIGIDAAATNGLHVASNFLGVAPDGSTPMPTTTTGIVAENCSNLRVGVADAVSVVHAQVGVVARNITPLGPQEVGAALENVNFNLDVGGGTQLGTWMETAACIEDSEAVTVGGATENTVNAVAGVAQNAYEVIHSTAVEVKGNRIGTDRAGMVAMAVQGAGILVDGGEDNELGAGEGVLVINATTGVLAQNIDPSEGAAAGLALRNMHLNLNREGTEQLGTELVTGVRAVQVRNFKITTDTQSKLFEIAQSSGNAIEAQDCADLAMEAMLIGTTRGGTSSSPVQGIGVLLERCEEVTLGAQEQVSVVNAAVGVVVRDCTPSAPEKVAATLQNMNFNLDESGENQLDTVMQTAVCVENSEAVTLGGESVSTMNAVAGAAQNAIEVIDSTLVHVAGNRIGTTRGGAEALPVTNGVVVQRGGDVSIGTAELASQIVAEKGVLIQNVATAMVENVYHGIEEAGAQSTPTGDYDLRVENSDFVTVRRMNAINSAAQTNVRLLGVQQASVSDSDFGHPSTAAAVTAVGISSAQGVVLSNNTFRRLDGDAVSVDNSSGVDIEENRIGTDDSDGDFPLAGDAIKVTQSAVSVIGNTIRNAGGSGVSVTTGGSNAVVRQNRIVDCGSAIQRASHAASTAVTAAQRGSTHAEGTVTGQPGETLTVDFYAYNPSASSPELDLFIGTTVVVLDGSGSGSYDVDFPATAPLGWLLTTTVTSALEGTTELSAPLSIAPPVDTDVDGFPDEYEEQFPSIFDGGVFNDPDIDSDGDGLGDGEEFELGTDPTDGGDSVIGSIATSADGFDVEVRTVAGRRYTLQRLVENPDPDQWVPIVSEYVPVGGVRIFTDPSPPPLRGIYRVVSELE